MKQISLVDCNSFYASCEKIFRPDLINRPVIVLSNNDGCVVAACPLAKSLGIPIFAPYFKVKEILDKHNVVIFSSNYALYADISNRIMKILHQFSDKIEYYSIDEAFLDMSGLSIREWKAHAISLATTIEKNVGIPVSVGLAPTKTLAKAANFYTKRMRIRDRSLLLSYTLIDDSNKSEILSQIPINKVWGIGRAYTPRLKALNIHTALDLLQKRGDKEIYHKFNTLVLQLVEELAGISCFSLTTTIVPKKSIITSRSFGRLVSDFKTLSEALSCYVTKAAEKLREQNSVCSYVTIFITTDPFKDTPKYSASLSGSFFSGTNDTRKLIELALSLLQKIYRSNYEYKKCGVLLSEISSASKRQLSLFDEAPQLEVRGEKLMNTIDKINHREGEFMVRSGSCGTDLLTPSLTDEELSAWKMRQQMKSPAYTTRWSEIPTIKL